MPRRRHTVAGRKPSSLDDGNGEGGGTSEISDGAALQTSNATLEQRNYAACVPLLGIAPNASDRVQCAGLAGENPVPGAPIPQLLSHVRSTQRQNAMEDK